MDHEELKRLAELAGYRGQRGALGAVDASLCSDKSRWSEGLSRFLMVGIRANEADENPFAPGPSDEEVGYGEVEIGRVVRGPDLGCPFRLPLRLLGEHQLWAGHSGSGKSFGIISELRQLIGKVAVWIFDTEDEYKNLAQLFSKDDLLILDYKDFRRNPFQAPSRFSEAEWQGRVKNIWRESFFLRDGSINLLGEILHELTRTDSPPTLSQFHRKLASLKFRVNSRNAGYWETLLNRTQALLNFMGPTYSCSRGHDLEHLLTKSVVFRLRGLSDDLFCFFANDLLSYVMAAREALFGCELRNIFVFDEGHRLFNVARTGRADLGEPIAFQAVRMIRKRGIGLIIGDQVPHLLPQVVRANLGTRIILRMVDGNPVRAVAESLSLSSDQREFLLELPKRRAVAQFSGSAGPFLIELPEFEMVARSDDEINWSKPDQIPGYVPEEEVVLSPRTQAKSSASRGSLSKEAIDYLEAISNNVFLPVTKRDRELRKSGWKGNALRNELLKDGLISMVDIPTGKRGSKLRLTRISEKGYGLLGDLKVACSRPKGKGSFEHQFWQHTIAEWAKTQGYSAEIECFRKGKSVDVGLECAGRSVACEILVSGVQKEMFNLAKDEMAGWDEIWFCVGSPADRSRLGSLFATLPSIPCEFKLLSFFA